VLVGAGGFARETAELVHALNQREPRWDLRGYVDDAPGLIGTMIGGLPVLGPIDSVHGHDHALVVCIGNPRNYAARALVVDRIAVADERYATLVHPAAIVPRTATLGRGTVIHATTVLTTDVRVGAHVAVMPGTILTHDDVVDDYATFGAGVRLAGGVTVERGAYVGSGALVRENLTIGAWATIGMGAIVTRAVPAAQVWVGAPAHYLRPVSLPAELRTPSAP
jgi:sugar O-acyltransferase (sialic acid O-acetyltransferase NeuD family)